MSNVALVLIKPDAYERGLREVIFRELDAEGLAVVTTKVLSLDEKTIRAYQPVLNEPSEFGEGWKTEVVEALSLHPVEVLIVKGENALIKARSIKKRMRSKHCPGTDYQSRVIYNLLHTADDPSELKNNIAVLIPEANDLI